MLEQFENNGIEKSAEEEKISKSIITTYVLRHGESIHGEQKKDTDPRRGLTEKGIEEAKGAGRKIAEDIAKETNPEVEIELRGFDSGIERANQTLIEIIKILTEKGYKISLPYSSKELSQDKVALEEMEKAGLVRILGEKQKNESESLEFLRPIKLTKDALLTISTEAKESGIDFLTVMMTSSDEKLNQINAETTDHAYQRMKFGKERINKLAQFLKQKERNHKKRTIYIAVSHEYAMGLFLNKELGIKEAFKKENLPNCEGFRVDFSGIPGEEPELELWGEKITKMAGQEVKK